MTSVCSKCGHANPANSNFCGQCGSAVAEQAGADRLPNEEYRTLTVLFTDPSSWTQVVADFHDENARALLTEIKRAAIDIIERHDGLVNQFVGDEIMALFGLSGSVERAPLRCARAAKDLHEVVRKISRGTFETSNDRPLRLHSGFATGSVLLHRDATDVLSGVSRPRVGLSILPIELLNWLRATQSSAAPILRHVSLSYTIASACQTSRSSDLRTRTRYGC